MKRWSGTVFGIFCGFALVAASFPCALAAQSVPLFSPRVGAEVTFVIGSEAKKYPSITVGTLPASVANKLLRAPVYATAGDRASDVVAYKPQNIEGILKGETPLLSAPSAGAAAFALLVDPFQRPDGSPSAGDWVVTEIKRNGRKITVEMVAREADRPGEISVADEYAGYWTSLIPLGSLEEGDYTLDLRASLFARQKLRAENTAQVEFHVSPAGPKPGPPTTFARKELRTERIEATSLESRGVTPMPPHPDQNVAYRAFAIEGAQPAAPALQVGTYDVEAELGPADRYRRPAAIPRLAPADKNAFAANNLTAVVSREVGPGDWIELNSIVYEIDKRSFVINVDHWKTGGPPGPSGNSSTQILVIPKVVNQIDRTLTEPMERDFAPQRLFRGDLSVTLKWRRFEEVADGLFSLRPADPDDASTINLSVLPRPVPVRIPEVSIRVDGPFDCIHCPSPGYPSLAWTARFADTIVLSVVVAQDGTVTSASVLKGHRLFHDAAMNAVQTWRFAPRETPTQQPAIVTIDFEVIHDMVLP